MVSTGYIQCILYILDVLDTCVLVKMTLVLVSPSAFVCPHINQRSPNRSGRRTEKIFQQQYYLCPSKLCAGINEKYISWQTSVIRYLTHTAERHV